jgi:hypothetical protein
LLGGVVDDGEQGLVLLGHESQPRMPTAIEVQEFAEARARLAAAAVPGAGAALGEQAGELPGRLHRGVGQRDGIVATGDLIEVAAIEAEIALAVEPQHPLDVGDRGAAGRGPARGGDSSRPS